MSNKVSNLNASKGLQKQMKGKQSQRISRDAVTMLLPKSSFTINAKTNKDGDPLVTVGGCEIISEITSNVPQTLPQPTMGTPSLLVFDVVINPANPQLFPRLSGMVSVFDKFRFKRLTASYSTGCPSTTAGAIGICFMTDPNDPIPVSCVTVGEYAHSSVGSVTLPLACEIKPSDDVWQFTSAAPPISLTATSSAYPNLGNGFVSPFYGSVRLIVKVDHASVSSTVSTSFLGYLSLSYEIELLRLKPVIPKVAYGSVTSLTPTVLSSAVNGINKWVPLTSNFSNIEGYFNTAASGLQLVSDIVNYFVGDTTYGSKLPLNSLYPISRANVYEVSDGAWNAAGVLAIQNVTLSTDSRQPTALGAEPSVTFLNAKYVRPGFMLLAESSYHVFSDEEKSTFPSLEELKSRYKVGAGGNVSVIVHGGPADASSTAGIMGLTLLPMTTAGNYPFSIPLFFEKPMLCDLLLDPTSMGLGTVTMNKPFCSCGFSRVSYDQSDSVQQLSLEPPRLTRQSAYVNPVTKSGNGWFN